MIFLRIKKLKWKLLLILLFVFFLSCLLIFIKYNIINKQKSITNNNLIKRKLKIVTTTGLLKDVVKKIAKNKVEVVSLMGPGVDPHNYKAAPRDIKYMRKSDIIIYNGLHLEGKLSDVLGSLVNKITYAATSAIDKDLIISDNEDFVDGDPHVWFDVKLWKKVVIGIKEILQKNDPINRTYYENNSSEFLSKLDDLLIYITNKIKLIPKNQRILITAHDAFEYFGRAYEFTVRGLQGISTTSDYGLNDIIDLINLIIDKNIKAIFLETSVAERPIQSVIQGCKKRGYFVKLGGPLYSDSMGVKGSGADSYITMMKYNIDTIVSGLATKK